MAEMAQFLAFDLAYTARTSGDSIPTTCYTLHTTERVRGEYKSMVTSKLFTARESASFTTALESGTIRTTTTLNVNPVPVEDFDVAMIEIYFLKYEQLLVEYGLEYLRPILDWLKHTTCGRDLATLGVRDEGFGCDNGIADLLLPMRISKLIHIRNEMGGDFPVNRAHVVDTWERKERYTATMRVTAPELIQRPDLKQSVRIPPASFPVPVRRVTPAEIWDGSACLNCGGKHPLYVCTAERAKDLACTICMWAVHHEASCSGIPNHPLGEQFFKQRATDAIKRRSDLFKSGK